jgi:excisionase family DNA binding protein
MDVEVMAMADTYRPPDGYLTMAGATEQLGVSIVTLRKLVKERAIPTYRDPRNGRARLLRLADVERLTQPVLEGKVAAAA